MKHVLLTKLDAGSYGLPILWEGARVNKELNAILGATLSNDVFRNGTAHLFGLYSLDEPSPPEGKMAVGEKSETFDGAKVTRAATWQDDPDYVAPITYTPLELMKQVKRQELASARYEEEVGGLDVNGVTVATDRESQTKLVAARIVAKEDPEYTLTWKADNGFVMLTSPTIIFLADAVLVFIKGLFEKEAMKDAAVTAALTVEDVNAITWTE